MPGADDGATESITQKDRQAHLDTITTRLTDKLRTLSLGVLAFCWALLTADKGLPLQINQTYHKRIILTAMLAIASLFFDLLHSLGNYMESDKVMKKVDTGKVSSARSDYKHIWRVEQDWMFWLKIVTCIAACCSLLSLMVEAI